jgi:hypothetical protein
MVMVQANAVGCQDIGENAGPKLNVVGEGAESPNGVLKPARANETEGTVRAVEHLVNVLLQSPVKVPNGQCRFTEPTQVRLGDKTGRLALALLEAGIHGVFLALLPITAQVDPEVGGCAMEQIRYVAGGMPGGSPCKQSVENLGIPDQVPLHGGISITLRAPSGLSYLERQCGAVANIRYALVMCEEGQQVLGLQKDAPVPVAGYAENKGRNQVGAILTARNHSWMEAEEIKDAAVGGLPRPEGAMPGPKGYG